MEKWEYCCIGWMVKNVSAEDKRQMQEQKFRGGFVETEEGNTLAVLGVFSVMGVSESKRAITKIGSEMAQLGLDGWELVSHAQVQNPSQEVFYFKRRIQG